MYLRRASSPPCLLSWMKPPPLPAPPPPDLSVKPSLLWSLSLSGGLSTDSMAPQRRRCPNLSVTLPELSVLECESPVQLCPHPPPDPDPDLDLPHPVVSSPPDPPDPPDPASSCSTGLGLSATQFTFPSLSCHLLHSLNLHVPFAMIVAVAGDPLSKSRELFLDVPLPPFLQLVARTLGRRVVCYKFNSLPLQSGSFYLSMSLPLPQYEDVTLSLCRLLPLFEVAVQDLQPISLPSIVFMVWLARVVMDLDFARSIRCCSCVSHLSTNGRLLAPDLVAGKLALSTALLEAAFAGLIVLDVLFDSQSLNLPLISKDDAASPSKQDSEDEDGWSLFYSSPTNMAMQVNEKKSVGQEAFARIAPVCPAIAYAITVHNLFDALTSSSGHRLHFLVYDKYIRTLENGKRKDGKRKEERSDWPLFGIKEMKSESCEQQTSATEEDYNEISIDE
ncbi:unnamed protein product [Microthlaspi erraticum]|uniref:Uncharacterized protein n=1 Tax=Microthlaspi erraticum TaxID=1685480 RepID=A0A6D2J8U5_9BRAS|nr:unnamed protein product [Microthlaspi erraticum]